MYKIIDAHIHTYPDTIAEKATLNLGDFYNFEVQGKGTYDDLEQQAPDNGIRGFFLLSVATNAKQTSKINDSTAVLVTLSRARGFETYGFACMHQDYPDFKTEIDRCEAMGLSGIKIHPDIQRMDIDCAQMYRICEMIEGRMPLFLHMGDSRTEYRYSEPQKLARLTDRFPRLKVVAAHFGGYRAWEEAQYYLYGRPNIWYDLSSALWAMSPEKARRLIAACGCDRVMYGSDYPVINPAQHLAIFMKIDIGEAERQNILYNNALRFLSAET
ncbi:MAG: amidohydrolase family protein [Eubacteriales bacterium]|jgi:predicted TIM-barrel fold metal-dependent hydrolase|nr:amidohydrolase family protein [Eubacteriales bacterium]